MMHTPQDDDSRFAKFLSDRYLNLTRIAEGGMGIVYKATDTRLMIQVAIKILKQDPGAVNNPVSVRRFQQEARTSAKLRHPNVIRELDCGVLPDNSLYIVMEFLDGVSLDRLLKSKGRMFGQQALPVFSQIAAGLEHAHGLGVLHRDLKPSNVILCEPADAAPIAKIVDFGLAVLMEDRQDISGSGLIGSPLYMAPEAGQEGLVDGRADIYSFGCLMLECLTLSPPFIGDSPMETLLHHRTKAPPLLSDRLDSDDFPAQLEAIVDKCLQKLPEDRFQSASELRHALTSLLAELDQPEVTRQARVEDLPEPAAPPAVAGGKPALIVSSLIALAGIAGVLYYALNLSPTFQSVDQEEKPEYSKKTPLYDKEMIDDIFEQNFTERSGTNWTSNTNSISDADLKELSTRPKIERLWLHDCDVTGTGFKYIPNLPLVSIAFVTCPLSTEGMKEVSRFKRLNVLRLIQSPTLTDEGVGKLEAAPGIHTLYINECPQVTDNAMTTVSQMHNMKRLSLKNMPQITSSGFAKLSSLKNLECLSLAGTTIDRDGLKRVKKFANLYALDLSELPVTDELLKEIAPLGLETISLRKTEVTAKGVMSLSRCIKLRQIDVRDCPFIDRSAYATFQRFMPDVRIVTENPTELEFEQLGDDVLMWTPLSAQQRRPAR